MISWSERDTVTYNDQWASIVKGPKVLQEDFE